MRRTTLPLLAALSLLAACEDATPAWQNSSSASSPATAGEPSGSGPAFLPFPPPPYDDSFCLRDDFPRPRQLTDEQMAKVRLVELEKVINDSRGDVVHGDVETRGEGLSCYRATTNINWIQNWPIFIDEFSITDDCVGPDRYRWLEHTDDGVTSRWAVLETSEDNPAVELTSHTYTYGDDFITDNFGAMWLASGDQLVAYQHPGSPYDCVYLTPRPDGRPLQHIGQNHASSSSIYDYSYNGDYLSKLKNTFGQYSETSVDRIERTSAGRVASITTEYGGTNTYDPFIGAKVSHSSAWFGSGASGFWGDSSWTLGFPHDPSAPGGPRTPHLLRPEELRLDGIHSERFAGCSVRITRNSDTNWSRERTFDSYGRPSEERYRTGALRTKWAWDQEHRLLQRRSYNHDLVSREMSYTWDGAFPSTETDGVGHRAWTWIRSGNLRIRQPAPSTPGTVHVWSADASGQPVGLSIHGEAWTLEHREGALVGLGHVVNVPSFANDCAAGNDRFSGTTQLWSDDLLVAYHHTTGVPDHLCWDTGPQPTPTRHEDADLPLWSLHLGADGLPDRALINEPSNPSKRTLEHYDWTCPAAPDF